MLKRLVTRRNLVSYRYKITIACVLVLVLILLIRLVQMFHPLTTVRGSHVFIIPTASDKSQWSPRFNKHGPVPFAGFKYKYNQDQSDLISEHSLSTEQPSEAPSVINNQHLEHPELLGDVEDFRKQKIVEMMKHAWDGYARYAWGHNELQPITKQPNYKSVMGFSKTGATIIDGLDTLYIMGLKDRYEQGREWIRDNFTIADVTGDISVFETTIRFVGGLLSCYALTKDEVQTKAEMVATALLSAFETQTGIPYSLVNIATGSSKNYDWAPAAASILAEIGSLHLEFDYLSVITGKKIFHEKVMTIRQTLYYMNKTGDLYPNYLHPTTGKWTSSHVSFGALGDSFYEYLLKSWLVTHKRDVVAKQMYDQAIEAAEKYLLQKSFSGLLYIAEMKNWRLDHKMDHLACFTGGMFALQASAERNRTKRLHYTEIAKEITRTCHETYRRSETKLGPESFVFTTPDEEAKALAGSEYYLLRPEVVESYFYMWRLTHNPLYREWAWEAAMAMEKYCKSEAGYSGIRDVYVRNPWKDDVQQSYFLAETLKYLYLIFSSDDTISLDEWVFNTEAHPLPVRYSEA